MRALNDKIRNSIANSYYLKGQAIDPTTDKQKSFELYEEVKKIDKKIMFYKKLNNALKELENDKEMDKKCI